MCSVLEMCVACVYEVWRHQAFLLYGNYIARQTHLAGGSNGGSFPDVLSACFGKSQRILEHALATKEEPDGRDTEPGDKQNRTWKMETWGRKIQHDSMAAVTALSTDIIPVTGRVPEAYLKKIRTEVRQILLDLFGGVLCFVVGCLFFFFPLVETFSVVIENSI